MDGLFWNKIFGAVLGTFLIVFALNEASHILVHPHELEQPAYVIEIPEGTAGEVAPEAAVDIGALLAAANPTTGATFARTLCGSCHTFMEGEPTLTGPNLWNIVNRPVASVDFAFTPAMRAHGGVWSYERLWAYLGSPPRDVPGTAMTFAGLPREDQRANVVAYLGTLSGSPAPFPAPLPAAELEPEPQEAILEADGEATGEATAAPIDTPIETPTEPTDAVATPE
jgi:cytochrome c